MYRLSNSSVDAVRFPPIDLLRVPGHRIDARSVASRTEVVLAAERELSTWGALQTASPGAGWQIGALSSAGAVLSRLPDPVPTCLVLDLTSPEQDGILLLKRLAAERPETPVVCITGPTDITMTVRAMKAGAVDVLAKPVRAEALQGGIREALDRSAAVLRRKKEMRALQDRHASLSHREQEVMALVVSGLLNKQVAGKLGISVITVKAHRGKVMRKMEARSLADLVKMSSLLPRSAIGEMH
jgi:FixJ family two-component response regulator